MTKAYSFIALLLALTVSGCATTYGLAPEVTRSGFNGAKVVVITRHGNACTTMVCTTLGAQWDSSTPTLALLNVGFVGAYKGIRSAQLNIDGTIVDLKLGELGTQFEKPVELQRESSRSFEVPLALVRQITASKRTWLRVHTTSGYVEDAVVDGDIDSKAFNALKRFLLAVDQAD